MRFRVAGTTPIRYEDYTQKHVRAASQSLSFPGHGRDAARVPRTGGNCRLTGKCVS
jgi:hypothetical protein